MKVRKIKQKIFIYSLLGNKKKLQRYRDRLDKFNAEQELRAQEAAVAKQEYENRNKLLDELATHRAGKKYDITCFVVTYNHEQSISKCLDSILSQKTKYNYLIKVLDDCSTDGTTEIIMDYATRYPDKIQLCLQPTNTRGMHISAALRTIDTEYWCMIDGDDWWCVDNKIETALDCLEQNKEYSMFGHDVWFVDHIKGTKESYVHERLKFNNIDTLVSTFDFEKYCYVHMSARIYRNVICWKKDYLLNRKRDFFIFFAYLDKGPLCFYDEKMSEYNYTTNGVFSSLSTYSQRYSNQYMYFTVNKYLNYRHDKFFTKMFSKGLRKYKKLFGKRLGWYLFMKKTKFKLLKNAFKSHRRTLNNIERGHNLFPKSFLDFCKNQESES